MSSVFTKIIEGDLPGRFVYRDDRAVAFLSIEPVAYGHVLVVPRAHYETVQDVPRDVGLHLYSVATQLIPVIQGVTGTQDMNIVVNSGAAAGQDVFHFHVHLIPRRAGDGFDVPGDSAFDIEVAEADAAAHYICSFGG